MMYRIVKDGKEDDLDEKTMHLYLKKNFDGSVDLMCHDGDGIGITLLTLTNEGTIRVEDSNSNIGWKFQLDAKGRIKVEK
jgi:hypothetical protein